MIWEGKHCVRRSPVSRPTYYRVRKREPLIALGYLQGTQVEHNMKVRTKTASETVGSSKYVFRALNMIACTQKLCTRHYFPSN